MKTTLSLLVHGESGQGKSWFGDGGPAPLLVIDLEGRAKYTPSGPKIVWDPREAPPIPDGTWNTCVVPCPDFDTLQQVYAWLRAGQHYFRSVVIDSLMEAQKRCIDSIAQTSAMDQQDWGALLRKLEALVRSYRDLLLLPTNTTEVVVFIVGSRTNDKTGKIEPLLQGQLRDTVPYYIDVVGYLFKQPTADGQFVRAMLIDAQPGFVAKDGTGKLLPTYGPIIQNPNLNQIHAILEQSGKPEALPAPAETTTAPVAAQEVAAGV